MSLFVVGVALGVALGVVHSLTLFFLFPALQLPGNHDGSVHLVDEPLFLRQDGEVLSDLDVLLVQHQEFNVLRVAFATE